MVDKLKLLLILFSGIAFNYSVKAASYQEAPKIINTNELSFTETYKANNLTVMIGNSSASPKGAGAGILLGVDEKKFYLITAKHVVSKIPKDKITVQMKGGFIYKGVIEYLADSLDLAVLSFQPEPRFFDLLKNNIPFNILSYRNEGVIDPGIRIFLTGNPKGENWRFYKENPGDIYEKKGNLYKFNSRHIERGHSGGGLFEQNGARLYLVGMTIRKRNKSTGDAYYIRSILEHIERSAKHIPIGLNVVRNYAVSFNRTGYVSLPHRRLFDQLSTNSGFTLEGWLYIKSQGNYVFPFIEKGWGVKVHPHVGAYFYASRSGPTATSLVITPKDKWFHLAVSYNRLAKTVKFYIDGVLVKQVPYTRKLSQNWESLSLGFSSRIEPNELAWGAIDEVRIWNYVRSDLQIKNHYKKVVSMLEDGCILYWRLDEGGGYIVEDFNGLNGIVVGSLSWIDSKTPLDYRGTSWTR